ncbi:hypothetical protein E2320_003967 [Naja naja]|nr:hypothetical protein E2320_003967 [Naja naja]
MASVIGLFGSDPAWAPAWASQPCAALDSLPAGHLLSARSILSPERKTYMAAIPQCSPASFPAELKRGSATKLMVGAIVRGPMNRIKNPMRPEKPTKIWKQDATIIAPCN